MKKYIAYVKEDGGCDYTIACGETVFDLGVCDYEKRARQLLNDYGEITHLTIYEVSNEFKFDVKSYREYLNEKAEAKEKAELEAKEKALYEKLKQKYEQEI